MKNPIPTDALSLRTNTFGRLSLNLTEQLTWEGFPSFAENFIQSVNGQLRKVSDGVDLRMWDVEIDAEVLCLVFDDFPVMVSVESYNKSGDEVLRRLFKELRGSQGPNGQSPR